MATKELVKRNRQALIQARLLVTLGNGLKGGVVLGLLMNYMRLSRNGGNALDRLIKPSANSR
jgi:hypothetical protein